MQILTGIGLALALGASILCIPQASNPALGGTPARRPKRRVLRQLAAPTTWAAALLLSVSAVLLGTELGILRTATNHPSILAHGLTAAMLVPFTAAMAAWCRASPHSQLG